MAKGQKRGNREAKKPKAAVKKPGRGHRRIAIPASDQTGSGEGRRQMTTAALEGGFIRFEIRDGMRRISCSVSNDALDAASGLTEACTPASRRRSFERFRTLIHAAALLRLEAQPLGSINPIILSGRDLRSVPPQVGTPRFGSAANRPTLPIGLPVGPVWTCLSASRRTRSA